MSYVDNAKMFGRVLVAGSLFAVSAFSWVASPAVTAPEAPVTVARAAASLPTTVPNHEEHTTVPADEAPYEVIAKRAAA